MKKATKLTGRIVVPGDPEYNQARLDFNLRFSKFPRVIVFCKNAQDVVNAVKWARERNVPIRARSGRHSYEAFSVSNGGIVIDVSEMKKVQVLKKKGIAIVQAGVRLEQLYQELWAHQRTIPGGTCPDVGIAGLTLGGGFGLLARLLGLACDSLVGIQMVGASGKRDAKLIQANRKVNSDLLWASCGGGGGNFGIVTDFIFKIHPVSKVSIFSLTWKWSDIGRVLKAWQRWASFVDPRLTATIQLKARQAGEITSTGQFVGDESTLKRLLKPLILAVPPLKLKTKHVPYLEAVQFFAGPDRNYIRQFKNSGTYVYDLLSDRAIRIVRHFLNNAPNQHALVWSQSLGGAVSQVPSNATAYVHRKAKMVFELNSSWKNAQEASKNIQWVEKFRKALAPFTVGDYVNWPDLHIKDWEQAYYGDNYKRLQRIKGKYDPLNVFHFPQSIRPITIR